jgi:hypothetical protein
MLRHFGFNGVMIEFNLEFRTNPAATHAAYMEEKVQRAAMFLQVSEGSKTTYSIFNCEIFMYIFKYADNSI